MTEPAVTAAAPQAIAPPRQRLRKSRRSRSWASSPILFFSISSAPRPRTVPHVLSTASIGEVGGRTFDVRVAQVLCHPSHETVLARSVPVGCQGVDQIILGLAYEIRPCAVGAGAIGTVAGDTPGRCRSTRR